MVSGIGPSIFEYKNEFCVNNILPLAKQVVL